MTGESNLTLLGSPQTGGPDNGRNQWAVLDSVSGTGSKTITANMSGSTVTVGIWVWRLSGGGSHGAPVGTSGTGSTLSVNVTTTAANAALFGGGISDNGAFTAGAPTYTKETGGGYRWYDGVEYDIDAGSVGTYAVDATTSGSGAFCWSAVEIYSGGGGGPPQITPVRTTRRNHPGRGPFSKGRFALSRRTAFAGLPVITAQPTEQTAADGTTATFPVTATGAKSYQWETQPALGGSVVNVSGGSGATTASYTTGALSRPSDAGRLYRCKLTGAGGEVVYSDWALLRVTNIPTSYASAVGLVVGSSLSWVGFGYVGASDSSSADASIAGQTLTNTVSLSTAGTFTAASTFAGQTLTQNVSLIAGAATADSTFAGQTLTNTVSLIAGAATADSTFAGQTLTNTVSLIAGAAAADSTFAGQTLTNTVSLIAGALSGASVFEGQTLTQNVSLIAGTFAADSTFAGQTLTNTVSLIAGSLSAGNSATFDGQLLTQTVSLLSGAFAADSTFAGQVLTNTVSLAAAGTMSADASFAGQLLTQTVSLLSGAFAADSTFAGQVLTNTVSLVGGALSGPVVPGGILSRPVGVDVSLRM
jgi:hypothetical protein